ncbi:MAG: cell division protein ZapA [Spirochaetota bacterium]|nr:cell division protein ZapA [Spirochaetota bacterium]
MESKAKVNIFGNTYNIKGDAPPEYIIQLAEFVDNRMKEVSNNITDANMIQIAILSALNIADEYFQLLEMNNEEPKAIEQKTNALITMLDEGLIGDFFINTNIV